MFISNVVLILCWKIFSKRRSLGDEGCDGKSVGVTGMKHTKLTLIVDLGLPGNEGGCEDAGLCNEQTFCCRC